MQARTVLVMVDIAHKDSATALCQEGFEQLCADDVLHVAYVMPYGYYSYIEPFVSEDSIKQAADRARQELSAILAATGGGNGDKAISHILRGGVGEQALLLAKKIDADLVMINAHRPDVKTHQLGSYASQIVRHAPCSVMVRR